MPLLFLLLLLSYNASCSSLAVSFPVLEKLFQHVHYKPSIEALVRTKHQKPGGQPLGKRLGLPDGNNLTTTQLYTIAEQQGRSFSQLLVQPGLGFRR